MSQYRSPYEEHNLKLNKNILLLQTYHLKHQKGMYSQICLKGSPQGSHKNWLLKTGDPLIQVHLHCILLQGTPKKWLLKAGLTVVKEPDMIWAIFGPHFYEFSNQYFFLNSVNDI